MDHAFSNHSNLALPWESVAPLPFHLYPRPRFEGEKMKSVSKVLGYLHWEDLRRFGKILEDPGGDFYWSNWSISKIPLSGRIWPPAVGAGHGEVLRGGKRCCSQEGTGEQTAAKEGGGWRASWMCSLDLVIYFVGASIGSFLALRCGSVAFQGTWSKSTKSSRNSLKIWKSSRLNGRSKVTSWNSWRRTVFCHAERVGRSSIECMENDIAMFGEWFAIWDWMK